MGYVTIKEVMDEAPGPCRGASATRVQALIDEWSDMVDRWTGWWFEKRSLTLKLDGTGTEYLHLPAPVIGTLTEIRRVFAVGSTEVISSDLYTVYNRDTRGAYDDRFNPKIAMVGYDNTLLGAAYGPHEWARWVKGFQNYEIDGDFGFVDTGDVTPPPIKRAVILLVLAHLPAQGTESACDAKGRDDLRSQTVAGRSETYGGPTTGSTMSGIVEVDRILWSHRAPPRAAAL